MHFTHIRFLYIRLDYNLQQSYIIVFDILYFHIIFVDISTQQRQTKRSDLAPTKRMGSINNLREKLFQLAEGIQRFSSHVQPGLELIYEINNIFLQQREEAMESTRGTIETKTALGIENASRCDIVIVYTVKMKWREVRGELIKLPTCRA